MKENTTYPAYDFNCSQSYSEGDYEDPTENRLWSCSYSHDDMCIALCEPHITEAQARAEMLIHLLENNLVTIEDINNRLNQ